MMLTIQNELRVAYFKRFKMEIALADLPPVDLPAGYDFVRWHEALLEAHAEVTFWSFYEEIDARVFPSLGNRQGCSMLMGEIRRKRFVPAATWLVGDAHQYCGSIQGIIGANGMGAIQNIGVTASHRGLGLGGALVLQALHGFRDIGLSHAMLEVTAENEPAIRLYRQIGFRKRKTIYKPVESSGAQVDEHSPR